MESIINTLGEEESELAISIKITYKDVSIELGLSESLIVMNALATKKISLRGGVWSSVGKQVEKPLMLELCRLSGVHSEYIDASNFSKNKHLDFDREVDFKLFNMDKTKKYKVEVKLMGRGNPESADTVVARKTDIFIADTLSIQNKNQLKHLNILFLELKNNKNAIKDFRCILENLKIPFSIQNN